VWEIGEWTGTDLKNKQQKKKEAYKRDGFRWKSHSITRTKKGKKKGKGEKKKMWNLWENIGVDSPIRTEKKNLIEKNIEREQTKGENGQNRMNRKKIREGGGKGQRKT